jgi:hypothetical protein
MESIERSPFTLWERIGNDGVSSTDFLTLRSHAKRGVSKGGQRALYLLPTLRDATLWVAPQGEVVRFDRAIGQ